MRKTGNNTKKERFGFSKTVAKSVMVVFLAWVAAMYAPLHLRAKTVVDTTRTYSIDELVVTGSNNATRKSMLPYTVSTIDSRQINATGPSQLLSALSVQVPSMFVSERNMFGFGVSTGGSGGIKIRGVGGSPTNAVLMMVDGQPQFAGIYSHHVADFYNTGNVERVEVLRGPGSVLYGSNAMGGVVNVITKSTGDKGVRTTLSSQYGSHNTWLSSITNTTRFGKFSSLVTLSYDRTDGLTDGFDFKQGSLYAKIGYDISRSWKVNADYSLMNFKGDDPVYPRLSDPTSTDVYRQDITRGEVSLWASNNYGGTNGSVRAYYSYGNHFIDDPRHFHSLDDRFGILAYQNFSPWKSAEVTLGFDFDTYTGKIPMSGGNAHSEGSLTTIGRKSITEYSPYATVAQHFFGEVLTVNAGVRMANSDRFGTQWIPQGGVVVRPQGDWTIKASLAKGYRNPSFRELYLYRTANADLQPERMMNYEVGVGKRFSRYLDIDLTAFYSRGSNMIQTVDMKNVNTGGFINKGVELGVVSNPVRNLTLRGSYSYLHTSLQDLTAAPKNLYFVGAAWQVSPKVLLNAEMRGVGSLYVADDMERQNYVLFNLRAAYKPFDALELFAKLNNLTDRSYTINRGYEMPGFNAMGGFKVSF